MKNQIVIVEDDKEIQGGCGDLSAAARVHSLSGREREGGLSNY